MASLPNTVSQARQTLLLGVAFVLLIVIAGTTTWLVRRSANDADLVAHTMKVQQTLSDLLLNVRRAESGQRGYLFTNQQLYLRDFDEARPEVEKQLQDLRSLVRDNPARVEDVARLTNLIDAKFAEMTRTIDLNRNGQREEARRLVLGGGGRDLAVEIRKLVDEAIADQNGLLVTRSAQSQQTGELLMFGSLAGTGLIILIGGFSVYLVQRNSRQRDAALAELASTNANLETIIEHRTADLTEANEEIQRFAYIVSHDLRSPLVNIMGFTTELENLRGDLLREVASLQERHASLQAEHDEQRLNLDRIGADFDEAIRFIKASITKMDRLINAVLRLSREGRREFKPETIDMTALLKNIQASVTHQTEAANATIVIDDLPDVYSDRLAVEQVFSNLIDNAVKYLRNDTPGRIEVIGQATQSLVVYEVRDNGRGIDSADHQRIFDLFRRAGAQDRPGEGIGLAHVRALVRRLGGYMRVSSELNKGSVFTVTLPKRFGQARERKAA
jgi:signal transduction histidine kinase